MTRARLKAIIAKQNATIAKLRDELRVERGMNRTLSKMQFAPQQKRSHLVSLKKYAAKKGVAA